MSGDVQLDEVPAALLATARSVTPGWVRRVTVAAAERGGVDPVAFAAELDAVVDSVSAGLLARLGDLLATDVDLQRTTPLSVFRDAVTEPTALLRRYGVSPPPAVVGGSGSVDDVYGLGPATWSDIDVTLHEPGLTWGAWKAATVLARRRDEGLR